MHYTEVEVNSGSDPSPSLLGPLFFQFFCLFVLFFAYLSQVVQFLLVFTVIRQSVVVCLFLLVSFNKWDAHTGHEEG
jgi:hypothetical protein